MNHYLIPANSKKSMLIFGLFRSVDLILFGCGLAVTFLLLLLVDLGSIVSVVLVMAPACVTGFLVMPVPNYHNILQVIINMIDFFTDNQKFIWKGWCFSNGKDEEK